ncbi:MAG: hypothetical protein MUO64_12345 [Anaerolineales bacterium]|nr:hypothetical protein [Anaerolineales bacterium]
MSTNNPSNSKIRVCKSVNGVTGRMIWFGKWTMVRMISSTSYNKSDGINLALNQKVALFKNARGVIVLLLTPEQTRDVMDYELNWELNTVCLTQP